MPELIAEALGAVGEELTDWLDLTPLDPAYRAYYPDGSTLDVITDTARMAGEISRVCGPREADGYLRFVDYARRLWQLERADFIERNLDAPDRPAHRQPAAAGGRRRVPAAPDEDQPVLPRPAHPADLLLPGDVRRPRPARRAGHLRGHRLPGLGGRGAASRAAASTRSPGRWPAPPRSTACRSGTAPRSTRVETARGRATGVVTADGERDPGRRGRAQPGPAGRLPRPAAPTPPRAGGCATRPPAWCCTSARRRATRRSPTTTSTSDGPGGAPSTR